MSIKFKVTDRSTGQDLSGPGHFRATPDGKDAYSIWSDKSPAEVKVRLFSGEKHMEHLDGGHAVLLDIYDGDVVSAVGVFSHEYHGTEPHKFSISFERGKFLVIADNNEDFEIKDFIESCDSLQVLGNIYQPQHQSRLDLIQGRQGGWVL